MGVEKRRAKKFKKIERVSEDRLREDLRRDFIKVLVLFIEEDNFGIDELSRELSRHPDDIRKILEWSRASGIYREVYNELYDFGGVFTEIMKRRGRGRM